MMPALPPLQLAATATSGAKGGAIGTTAGMQQGDWNVNFGGGSISPAANPLIYVAVAAGVWWLTRRKA